MSWITLYLTDIVKRRVDYFLFSAILKILQGLNISNEKQQNGAEIEPQFSPAIFSLTTHEIKSIF